MRWIAPLSLLVSLTTLVLVVVVATRPAITPRDIGRVERDVGDLQDGVGRLLEATSTQADPAVLDGIAAIERALAALDVSGRDDEILDVLSSVCAKLDDVQILLGDEPPVDIPAIGGC